MHHRITRKRTQSASDEEGGALILEDHNHHHNHNIHHHNGTITTSVTKHNINLKSVRSHLGSSSSYYRWAIYLFGIVCLLTIALCLLILVGFSIFSVFHVALRGRPAWLYGKPVLRNDISTCFVMEQQDNNDHHHSSSQSQSHDEPPRVLWEWHNYTTDTSNNEKNNNPTHIGPRLLIAQYSGFGEYAQFLNLISPVHQEYAEQHGYDYVILQGTLLEFSGIRPDCLADLRATFDKIPLLEMAYSLKHKYDYVLVLDTDAMIVNHHHSDHNIKHWMELLPPNQLLAAQRVMRYDLSNTWDVNAGVTLWNLHHGDFKKLVRRWKQLSQYGVTTTTTITTEDGRPSTKEAFKQHLETILTKNDDQYFLQTALLQTYSWWNRPVVAVLDEFKYYSGTLVKHFKRDKRSWSTSGLNQRLERVKEAIREICISQRKGISYCLSQDKEPPIDYTKRKQPEVTTWL